MQVRTDGTQSVKSPIEISDFSYCGFM